MTTIGYPVSRAGFDNQLGGLVTNLRNAFNDIVFFKALLDDSTIYPDSVLQASPLGYTGSTSTGEIKQMRDSLTALALLNTVSRGGSTVPSLFDFWFDAKHLAGSAFR